MGSVADRQKEAAGYLMDGLWKVQYSLRNRVAEPPLHGEQGQLVYNLKANLNVMFEVPRLL